MNYRLIAHYLSLILRLEAAFMVPGLIISVFHAENAAVIGFVAAIVAAIVCSLVPLLKPPKRKTLYAQDGFVIVGLVWIMVSAFGALPFYVSGAIPSLIDSFFETVSGFTTTGASILTDVEALPLGLLYWRSFTHWLGGMGVLVLMLAIVPMSAGSGDSLHLLRAESPGPQVGKLVPRMGQTAKILYGIYVAMTALQILLLLAGGMPLFDAVTISFGTAGTGGFAIKNSSLADYSAYVQVVVTVFMALFGVNFNLYYLLLLREFKRALFNEELLLYVGLMLGSILIIALDILPVFGGHFGVSLQQAAFQVSSVMTTTGYATADFNLWPQLSRMLLVMLMLVGASAGSTGGGIKCARLVILFKSLRAEMQRMLHPRSVKLVRVNGEVLDEAVPRNVFAFMSAYCLIAVISMLLLSLDEYSLETNVTAVLACLNNIGPGLDLVGPTGNFSHFSGFNKLVLSANMLLGRLEIFPLLMLFVPSIWKRNRKL